MALVRLFLAEVISLRSRALEAFLQKRWACSIGSNKFLMAMEVFGGTRLSSEDKVDVKFGKFVF